MLLVTAPGVLAEDDGGAADCPPPFSWENPGMGIQAPLPGRVISYAVPRRTDGGRDLVLLLGPPGEDELDPGAVWIKEWSAAVGTAREQLAADGHSASGAGAETTKMSKRKWAKLLASMGDRVAAHPCPVDEPLQDRGLFRLDGQYLSFLRSLGPGATALLAMDVDGDGREELLLQDGHTLVQLPGGATGPGTEDGLLLLTDADLDLAREEPTQVRFPREPLAFRSPMDDEQDDSPRRQGKARMYLASVPPGQPHVLITRPAAVEVFVPPGGASAAGAGQVWVLGGVAALPLRTSPRPDGLLLSSPQLRRAGVTGSGDLVLAAGPVPFGPRRLGTVIVRLSGGGPPQVQEVWSRLAGDEVIAESGFLLVDDVPHLWVVTGEANKVEFFGEDENLRIFRLQGDRTRSGGLPVLALDKIGGADGSKGAWDVDGDGRDDLVLASRDDKKIELRAYLQQQNGSFRTSARKQRLEGEGSPRRLGEDVDGDGRPDLVMGGKQGLWLHAGLPPARRGDLVTREARRVATVAAPSIGVDAAAASSGASGEPMVAACSREVVLVDMDGDGAAEWLCPATDPHRRPYFKVIRFTSR